ncbi:transposase [uncultured Catenibacterium sp.]
MVQSYQDSIERKKIFWSDGYFACSIGEVSSATIQKYIKSQG